MPDLDEHFFAAYRDRKFRIRETYEGENEAEFRTLGPHREDRRRIIAMRAKGRLARARGISIMRIPFLLFADETVEDRDDILEPIVAEIMKDAARKYGIRR